MPGGLQQILEVGVLRGKTIQKQYRFRSAFNIGRHSHCDIAIDDDLMSRFHAEVSLHDGQWWIRDLGSMNGILVDKQRVTLHHISSECIVELGNGGPVLAFQSRTIHVSEKHTTPIQPKPPSSADRESPSSRETLARNDQHAEQAASSKSPPRDAAYIRQRYFGDSTDDDIGDHTHIVRQIYQEVQTKQRRLYSVLIGSLVVLVALVGSIALVKHIQVERQREQAQGLFYDMKQLELGLAQLTEDSEQSRALLSQLQSMQQSYEQYVEELGVYDGVLSEQEKLIYRMARIFGESEINVPEGFVREVKAYINKWQSSDRLVNAIRLAHEEQYVGTIKQRLLEYDLPPQYFYLALQESSFNTRIVGPPTRYGHAKGMWQFIPKTALEYGLKTGPLVNAGRYDRNDERHDFQKSTLAAARYLRFIYSTEAQASGLLVMASYNWGEHNVVEYLAKLPANPRERNFWQLWTNHHNRVPNETYNYVFYIFSAAVIGENPGLFGFDFDNPLQ